MAKPQKSELTATPVEAVLALYEQTWAEINRLRDYEWKIAYYFASLSVGQIALLTSESFRDLLTLELSGGGTIHLIKDGFPANFRLNSLPPAIADLLFAELALCLGRLVLRPSPPWPA